MPEALFFIIGELMVLLLFPFLVFWGIKRQRSRPSRGKIALVLFMVYTFFFGISLQFMVNPPVKVNYSTPFDYERVVLKEKDLQTSENLHDKMIKMGMNDPQGFIFVDKPGTGEIRRKIWLESTESFYKLHYGNSTVSTLLQVHLGWLKDVDTLRGKFDEFLNVSQGNESYVNIVVNQLDDGKTIRVSIKIRDPESDGMVWIVFDYGKKGIASVSIIYATNDYSFDKPSKVYLEVSYSIIQDEIIDLGSFVGIVTSFCLAIGLPIVIHSAPKNSYIGRIFENENNKSHINGQSW